MKNKKRQTGKYKNINKNDAMLIITDTIDNTTNSNNKSEEQPLKFIELYQQIIRSDKIIAKELKERKKLMKQLYQAYSTDMKYASKHRKKRKKNTKSGVTIPLKIPNDLADFMNVEHSTEMTRCELQKILCKTLKDKKLQYEKDKRILRADDELKKIFNLPESVNQVTDAKDKNGFTIFTLQKYISKKLKESK